MTGIRFPTLLTCALSAFLLGLSCPTTAAQEPKSLFSKRFQAKNGDVLVEVHLRIHSMKPEGYEGDERWMRGDLLEVRTTRADDPKQAAAVIWRNFYRHDPFALDVRRWSAVLGPTPNPDEICLAFTSGRALHVFRVSLSGQPRPLPMLPKGFENIKEFRILSAEESRKHYAKLFAELGLLGVSDEAWQAALREHPEYQIRALNLALEDRNIILTTKDPTNQSLRFQLDWDKKEWRFVSGKDRKDAGNPK